MRTLAVRGLARASAPGVSLLVSFVLGGVLLLGGPAAADEGHINFVQMTVQRCAESGACEWKLSCGPQGQETELFAGKEAKTKYSVQIGKHMDVKKFPVTIQCTVWEDDGFFGASWEKAGSGTVMLPSGGDYRLDIGNKEQGMVRVRIVADSVEVGIAPPPAAAPAPAPVAAKPGRRPAKPPAAPRFVAAFIPQMEGQALLIGMEWDRFKARMNELSNNGLQIFAFSSFEYGGKRLWNGVFRPSQEEMVLLVDMDFQKFADVYKRVTGGNKRLIDLEVYDSGKKWAGLYRDLGESHNLWVGQSRKDFLEKVKDLASAKGQQLLDVEVYKAGGPLLYAGPFLQRLEATELWTGLDQAAFQNKWNGLKGKDWQVVSVTSYQDGDKRLFDAIARAGDRGDISVGLELTPFLTRWEELADKGMRLISLDVYQE
ncbi:MAG TPA: hypothetical protein VF789_16520 [Thermoanaerobaculia bacterium]